MRSPFRSKPRITQAFGARPEYYGQFNLKGHEGLDCVPTGTVWDVLALEDGIVVNESDDPRSGAYGIWVTIWHPSIKKATQYCHLQSNYVSGGDKITKGQRIGTMGTTGNSSGAHLHLNLYDVDQNGVRLNRNNGYNGGIDPLPWLESLDSETPVESPDASLQRQLDETRADRDKNWNLYQQEREAKIKLEDAIDGKNKTIDSLTRELEQKKKELQLATETNTSHLVSIQGLTSKLQEKNTEVAQLLADIEKATLDLEILKAQRKDLSKYETKELVTEVLNRIFRKG